MAENYFNFFKKLTPGTLRAHNLGSFRARALKFGISRFEINVNHLLKYESESEKIRDGDLGTITPVDIE